MPNTTNLSNLLVSGVPTMGMPGIPATTGNVFFVDSALYSTNGSLASGDASFPFGTIAAATAQAVADHGDIVVIGAAHAETITAAAGITLNKSGVQYIGLNIGADRPTITFTTSTAATLTITAANVSLTGIVGVCGINGLVSAVVVSAADVTLGMEWHEGATSATQAIRAVLTTAAADRFTCNLTYIGFTSGGTAPVNAIRLVGCDTGFINVNFYGVASTAVVEFVTTACTNVQVTGVIYNSGTTNFSKNVVDTVTGSTWSVNAFDATAGTTFAGGSGAAVAVSGAVATGSEKSAVSATAVMVNGNTLFTVSNGPIEIVNLMSICATANGATASTLQYSSSGTLGATTQTISAASASLANATAGTTVILQGTALATAPLVNANAANINAVNGSIIVPAGTITAVIGTGSTTGTWTHYIRYRPLSNTASVA